MDIPNGRPDLGIVVGRQVFFEEIDQPAFTLEDSQEI
jgi:hypothetical protein